MSYAEHGPRIFLAGRPNTGIPLIYGDYVLPRKRVEGRLKLHDSCSDIRAWSPNFLENSRYFRELNEHDSSIGKIIPFNVVVDNIIQLNSQTQNELQVVKKELHKYKNLKLTPRQEKDLESSDCNRRINEPLQRNDHKTGSLLKDAFLSISKSVPLIRSNSCLSVHIPPERYLQSNRNDESTVTNQPTQIYSYSLNAFRADLSSNNYTLVPSFRPALKSRRTTEYNEKSSSCIEYIDVAIQVEQETRNVGIQVMPRLSCTYKFSDEDNSDIEPDKITLRTNNQEERSFECNVSNSGSSEDISLSESDSSVETESDFDIRSGSHKGIIIQKDSEIIVLKNELCVKDAEMEELRDVNKNLEMLLRDKEDCINTQQKNLKILHDKLIKLDHQRHCEVDDLKEKFYSYKQLAGQLEQDLRKECESCYLQVEEIERLQLCVEEMPTLRRKLQDMEQLAKKAGDCDLALEQLSSVLQEKDKLKKQNHEQSCVLADQEKEINELLILIGETSAIYEEQKNAKSVLENLEAEINDKTTKLSQHEEELLTTKREISDFFGSLKQALNSLEEFNGSCDRICNCPQCDLDISEEANNVLQNVNTIMTRFQSYKIERQNLLKQIEDLKYYVENDKQQIYLAHNLRDIVSEDFYYESDVEPRSSSGKDSVIVLNTRQNKSDASDVELEHTSNSVKSENSLNTITNDNCSKYIIKLNEGSSLSEVEKVIVDYISDFLSKIHSLTQELQVYAEIERPLMIKQIDSFYEVLKHTESAINTSQDVTSRKEQITNLYNQYKEEHKKYKSYAQQMPRDLYHKQIKINEFIEAILYQLLNGILDIERGDLHDKQINQAFEVHFRSCIDRINVALQGAGDRRQQITEELEKQQSELQKKDVEIARLKDEVAQQLARKGEGDCLAQKESKKSAIIQDELCRATAELNEKDALVSMLKEQCEIIKNELSKHVEECSALRKQNDNLNNMKNRLLEKAEQSREQLAMKNKEIRNLSEQLDNLLEAEKSSQAIMDDKIKELEKEFHDKFFEKAKQSKEQLAMKNKEIGSLLEQLDNLSKAEKSSQAVMNDKIRELEKEFHDKVFEKAEQSKEQLAMKNKEIRSLSEQLGNLSKAEKSSQAVMDDKIRELEKELHDLAVQNLELRNSLMQTDQIISGKDETINTMKSIVDRNKHILSHKGIEYQNTMDEKHRETEKLKEENEQLNEKVQDMNRTIASLTEHNDKIDFIYKLQEDFAKLEKNEKKLKAELNNLKAQLANDQNNNKKLDNNLDVFLRENEHLKKSVEYWKNENSELSMKLSNQMVEEKLKSDLYTLSNTIYNRLLILKNQFESEKDVSSDQSKEKLQDKGVVTKIYVDEKMTLTIDDINNEQTSEYDYQNRKVKENEIEEVEEQELLNVTITKSETFKANYVEFGRLSPSESNNPQISYKTDRLVNESEANEAETRKLLEEIEIRDSEIRNLKDVIDRLAQDNTHLRAVLKSQIEEYQDKITLMKKNYDSSLNALCVRHKESVETLQRRFEDIITGERSFDSENWLQSLNTKELTELYERIRAITGDSNLMHARDENHYFYKNSVRKEFYTEISEPEKMLHTSYKNICENEAMSNNIVSLTQEDNSELQNQWRFTILRQTQEYPVSQMQDYKFNLKENFGCSNREIQPPELEHKYEKEKEVVKDNTVDQQRWNFIKQCSAYHKLGNSCEY